LRAAAGAALAETPSIDTTVVAGAREPTLPNAITFEAALAADAAPEANPGTDLDLAMLVYTSGSTGFPKGVMMTHANVVAAASSITTYLESRADDVVLSVLPLAFDYGLYQALMCAKVGATLVLEKSFTY